MSVAAPPHADPAAPRHGRLAAVCTGGVRVVQTDKRRITTGIWKEPVHTRVEVRGIHVGDDEQADYSVHGGPDKAVYAYGGSDTAWWESEIGRSLGPGAFGENLWVEGFDVSAAVIGERWRIADVELEVCQPRVPCFKLGLKMGDPRFVKLFADAQRPGVYLRIAQEGEIGAGDAIEVVDRPEHGITSALVFHAILHDHSLFAHVLTAAPFAETAFGEWMAEQVAG